MPASIALLAGFLVIAGLSIVLAVIVELPFLAVPFFLFGFIVFLLWRAARNTDAGAP